MQDMKTEEQFDDLGMKMNNTAIPPRRRKHEADMIWQRITVSSDKVASYKSPWASNAHVIVTAQG